MLITHAISRRGVLDDSELALLVCAFDAACNQIREDRLNVELVAKEIVAAFEQGVMCDWELANACSRMRPAGSPNSHCRSNGPGDEAGVRDMAENGPGRRPVANFCHQRRRSRFADEVRSAKQVDR